MVKAKIEHIGVGSKAEIYVISVNFPEFSASGGTTQNLIFETTQEEYQNWTPPNGVTKNPKTFLEHKYVRPAYDKLKNIHQHFKPLKNAEFDW